MKLQKLRATRDMKQTKLIVKKLNNLLNNLRKIKISRRGFSGANKSIAKQNSCSYISVNLARSLTGHKSLSQCCISWDI